MTSSIRRFSFPSSTSLAVSLPQGDRYPSPLPVDLRLLDHAEYNGAFLLQRKRVRAHGAKGVANWTSTNRLEESPPWAATRGDRLQLNSSKRLYLFTASLPSFDRPAPRAANLCVPWRVVEGEKIIRLGARGGQNETSDQNGYQDGRFFSFFARLSSVAHSFFKSPLPSFSLSVHDSRPGRDRQGRGLYGARRRLAPQTGSSSSSKPLARTAATGQVSLRGRKRNNAIQRKKMRSFLFFCPGAGAIRREKKWLILISLSSPHAL